LVYVHAGTLWAAPFDLDRLAVTGPPVPLIEGVTSNAANGGAQVAVPASGTLVAMWLPSGAQAGANALNPGRLNTTRRLLPSGFMITHSLSLESDGE
jgi:hypothetical protein